jgi:hypothetical protein
VIQRVVPGDARVTVAWAEAGTTVPSGVSGYRIAATPGDTATTVGPTDRMATVPGLSNGTFYTVEVAARSRGGVVATSLPSQPVTPTARVPPVFPLSVSPDGRVLVDKDGVPFRIQGDAGWELSTRVTPTELRAYLDDRRARGFNTVLVMLVESVDYGAGEPRAPGGAPGSLGAQGARPFLKAVSGAPWDGSFGTADLSTPNERYFQWIDEVVAEAARRDMLVLLTTLYLGFDAGRDDGWQRALGQPSNSDEAVFEFGRYLGVRYRDAANIVWAHGGDSVPPAGSRAARRLRQIVRGLEAGGDRHLHTAHWSGYADNPEGSPPAPLSTDQPDLAPLVSMNAVYSAGDPANARNGRTFVQSRRAWDRRPALPAFLIETTYEGEHGLTRERLRAGMWWAALSTIGGAVFGNNPVWKFDTAKNPGWPIALESPGTRDFQRLGALFNALPWHRLVPSGLGGTRSRITSPGGDPRTAGDAYVAAAATTSGDLLVAYVPPWHDGSVGLDPTGMSSPLRARWYDPTSGTFTPAGVFGIDDLRSVSPPRRNSGGAADWVLVVDVPPSVPPMAPMAAAAPRTNR